MLFTFHDTPYSETKPTAQRLVFGGERGQRRERVRVLPWSTIDRVDWA